MDDSASLPSLRVLNLLAQGPIPYRDALDLQRRLVTKRQEGIVPDTLLLLQHPPTVTYGKAADPCFRLLTPEQYADKGIELIATDRGGDVTYHGPGQLIAYPILHLGEGRRDLHRYVRALEEVIICAAADLGVPDAARAPWHAGVWVGEGYLAALGVRVSRWVTSHGFALNVTNEIQSGFATIVPCGVADKRTVSLSGLSGRDISIETTAASIIEQFSLVFDFNSITIEH